MSHWLNSDWGTLKKKCLNGKVLLGSNKLVHSTHSLFIAFYMAKMAYILTTTPSFSKWWTAFGSGTEANTRKPAIKKHPTPQVSHDGIGTEIPLFCQDDPLSP